MRTFDLKQIDSSTRFGFWREVLCNVYVALDSEPVSRHEFVGAVTEHPFSDFSVSNISSQKQLISRNARGIRRDTDSFCFLNLQVRGSCRVVQAKRETVTNPGEFSIVDSTEPFLHDYFTDEWEMHSFKIPKRVLDTHMDVEHDCVARKVTDRTPVGKIAIDYLTAIARNPQSLTGNAIDLNKIMVDLIGLSLGRAQDVHEGRRKSWKAGLCHSILSYVELNFADPGLTPSKVAAHFGISTRYLHMIMEERDQTFGQSLLRKRLERSAQNLLDERCVNISDAAFRAGFNDLSHFSRVFRQHYGMSPREYRNSLSGPENRPLI